MSERKPDPTMRRRRAERGRHNGQDLHDTPWGPMAWHAKLHRSATRQRTRKERRIAMVNADLEAGRLIVTPPSSTP